MTAKKVTKKRTARMKGRARGGASVLCPRDGRVSRVVITRRVDDAVVRNRQCVRCGHKFTTTESIL